MLLNFLFYFLFLLFLYFLIVLSFLILLNLLYFIHLSKILNTLNLHTIITISILFLFIHYSWKFRILCLNILLWIILSYIPITFFLLRNITVIIPIAIIINIPVAIIIINIPITIIVFIILTRISSLGIKSLSIISIFRLICFIFIITFLLH